MQPADKNRRKIKSGVARARLLIKRDLSWMPGYPLELYDNISGRTVRWQPATLSGSQPSKPVTLTSEHLRKAQMTVSKLQHRFPRALPKIVDSVDDWSRRTDIVLELLKSFIHDGQAFSVNDALASDVFPTRWVNRLSKLRAARPLLEKILDSVAFLGITDLQSPDRLQLQWFDKHARELELLVQHAENPCIRSLRFYAVRESLPPGMLEILVRCETDPAIKACQWKHPEEWLRELRSELKKAVDQNEFVIPVQEQGPTLAGLIKSIFDQICLLRPKQQRLRLRLLQLLLDEDDLNRIVSNHERATEAGTHCRKLLKRLQSGHAPAPSKFARKTIVSSVGINDGLIQEIGWATSLGNRLEKLFETPESEVQLWTDLVAAIPTDHLQLQGELFFRFVRHAGHSWTNRHEYVHVVKQLVKLIKRRGVAPTLLNHWSDYVSDLRPNYEFLDETSRELEGHRQIAARTVRLLELVIYDRKLSIGNQLLTSLVEFAKASDDNELCTNLIMHLADEAEDSFSCQDIKLAILFGDSVQQIARVLRTLSEDYERTQTAETLKSLAADPVLKAIVAKRLAINQTAELQRLANIVSVSTEKTLPKRECCSSSSLWIDEYPTELHPSLHQLIEATPDAEDIADRILGKAFPSASKLQQQINAIADKLAGQLPAGTDTARMERRLQNLRRRQESVEPVSSHIQTKLIGKIIARAELEILERYTQQCQRSTLASLKSQFDISTISKELFQPPLDQVLAQINQLNKPMRDLGRRLLFETLSRTTRNFDDEPANLAFRDQMEQAGIRMEPWLSDQVKHTATTADGSSYGLAFTRDVVDFLLMGFHFGTCLSPDSCNFFSTVANAVDLNKRVVYGKTEDGRIIGRCLLVLSDTGKILSYHRYSHDAKDGFTAAVDAFAKQLAVEMRTTLASTGNVTKLVANRWYDDGPIQTNQRKDALHGDSGILAHLLREYPISEVFPQLVKEVGRVEIEQQVVELATDQRVRNHSEFLHPLMDQFESEMSWRQRFIVSVNVGAADISHRLLSQLRWQDIVRFVGRNRCYECDYLHGIATYRTVFDVLTQFHPTLALRAIRATRPSSVRDDLKDTSSVRREALVKVHRMLGRSQLADKLQEK